MTRQSRTVGHHKRIQFGWASGVTLTTADGNLAKFQDDIDRIAANGGRWVRWGIPGDEVTTGGGIGSITWSTPDLELQDAALAYANSKGVQVCLLVVGPPDFAIDYTFANYRTTCGVYWSFLVSRWAGQVALWQFFNESNGSDYQTHDPNPFSTVGSNNFPVGYLTELATLIGDGRALVKAANPGALVSTSLEGYPMGDDIQAEWEYYLDVVGPQLDVISLHMYPEDSTEITAMATRCASIRADYGKPIFVTEFGISTTAFTEAEQSTLVQQMVASLKNGQVKAMFLYTLRNLSATPTVDDISNFGIMLNNGTPKAGYTAIMNAMR